MATRYVTLKDSNGDTIYPQSVIAQVANGEITTGLLADGAVTAAKLSGMPSPDYSNTLNDWGTISSSTTKSITADGFICGKALIFGADSSAYITINAVHVAGFPYNGSSAINNLQASFCFPVKKGMIVNFNTGSGGQFQAVKQVGWTI